MAYYIFLKNSDNIEGTLYRVAENLSDLNNLNINQVNYKIIENVSQNFDDIKINKTGISKYNNNTITFINLEGTFWYKDRSSLTEYITKTKNEIKPFIDNNKNHPLYSRWNDYYNLLSSLDVNVIMPDPNTPLNTSLEQYLKTNGQIYLNTLQLP
jgi:hypothetical protein